MSHLFSCCTVFMLSFLCTLFMLHFSGFVHFFHVEFFLCCTFFVLYRFHVAPFFVLHCFQILPFAHFFHVALFSCCTLFSCWTLFSCSTLHVARFSCCANFMLFFFVCCTPSMLQTPSQVFSCEICEISKNTYFGEHLQIAVSKIFIWTLSMSKSHNIVKLQRMNGLILLRSEAVVQRCSAKIVFLGLRLATLLKKSFWCRCFPVNFTKFLRTPFFTKHFR